ncbi:MAG: DegV family protein [Clostridia bacterium]|nr:DegV family protein [Clostridia bacterium]
MNNNKFVIVSDSCCDLGKELREEFGISYIPMTVASDKFSMKATLDWENMSAKDYYDVMRGGERVYTSQVTPDEYRAFFEECVKNGQDILSISCSSALSASIKASYVVRDELCEKYPDRKIICIDSLISGGGLGMLCVYASRLRAEGKDISEVASAVEQLKMKLNQAGTVDELKYLKMSGRISAGKAFFGTLMGVKPLIVSNVKGENVSTVKARGRLKSIRLLVDDVTSNYVGDTISEIFISHADCLEEAENLKSSILEKLPNVKIIMGYLNPIMGASCGPNTLVVYYNGKEKPNTDE